MAKTQPSTQQPELYAPLGAGKTPQIRLLTLFPGQKEDPIRCALQTVSLALSPPYDAVSYVWGNVNERTTIKVSGYDVSVLTTAATALHRLRHLDAVRTLWIDAVCINQEDLNERNQQVAVMRRVYNQASTNLIQLGDAHPETADRAIQSIQALVDEISHETVGMTQLQSTLFREGAPVYTQKPIRAEIDVDALTMLLSARWFKRLWVMQEACSAQHNTCYFGNSTIDLLDVLRACAWLDFKRQVCPTSILHSPGYRVGNRLWAYVDREQGMHRKRRGSSVAAVLDFSRGLEATDPRDRVFAVLAFMECAQSESLPLALMPDYSKSKMAVYRDATRYALQEGGVRRILSRVHHWIEADVVDETWPSWVPRWDRDRDGNWEASSFPDLYNPDDGVRSPVLSFVEGDENVLSVCGVVADTIDECTSTLVKSKGLEHRLEWIQDAERIATKYHLKQDTLACTIVAGANAGHQQATLEDIRDYEAWRSLINECEEPRRLNELTENDPDEAKGAAKFEVAFSYASNVRRIFLTSKARLGLGPSMLRKSDIIAVIYGGKTPFVLRPIQSGYRILGQCYVSGVMNGEAVREHRERVLPDAIFDIR